MEIKEGVNHWSCTIELTSMGYKPVFTVAANANGKTIKVRSVVLAEEDIAPTIVRMTKDIQVAITKKPDWSFVAEAKDILDDRG